MPNDLSQAVTPQPMNVSLVMTPAMFSNLQVEQGALSVALAYEIDSTDMAVEANRELVSVKERFKKVKSWKSSFVEPAKQIIANAEGLFDPALNSLTQAEGALKSGLMAWQTKETKRIEDARRAQEAIEREARQKAEREAAAERAKAEEKARELQRQAAEQEAIRLKAIAEGNAKAAAEAAAASARLAEKAQAAAENGEAKALATEMAAAAAIVVPAETAPAKLAGFSTRDNWVAEMTAATETEAIILIAAAIEKRPELVSFLSIDMVSANKMAKALKGNFNVPGLVAKNKPVAASRG